MREKAKTGVRRIWLATALLLMLSLAFPALAATGVSVFEKKVTDQFVALYLNYPSEIHTAEAQIGTEAVDVETGGGRDSLTIVTWLLLDNSISINRDDQIRAKELLTNIVAGRTTGERFNLCTFSDHLNVLLWDCQDFSELKKVIDGIGHVDQETYLTDVVMEVLDLEATREGLEFVRLIVISDGVDNNPQGITKGELLTRLEEQPLPIYTFGCRSGNNTQALKEMYALSRQTGGESWTLTDLDTPLEAISVLGGNALPKWALIEIPEKLRDGTSKGIRLVLDGENVAETEAKMPFGQAAPEQTVVPSTPVPTPAATLEPVPAPVPAPEPEPMTFSHFVREHLVMLIICGLILILVAGAFAGFQLYRRKKEKERFQAITQEELTRQSVSKKRQTEILKPEEMGVIKRGTKILVGGEAQKVLILTDTKNLDKYFEEPLLGKVSIGRDETNRICLDYERSVSGIHCEIYAEGEKTIVHDLHSSNGTLLNGNHVVDVAEVKSGDLLRIGRLEMKLEIR